MNISFLVNGTATGNILNRAEISESFGGIDADSTPDSNNTDAFSGDNNLDGDGSDDEDDHDPATIFVQPVFDLALQKVLTTTGDYYPGDVVEFSITIINQGQQDAYAIEVYDEFPSDLIYLSGHATNIAEGWTASGTSLSTVVVSLPVGTTQVVSAVFEIDESFAGGTLTNWAEIAAADNDTNTGNIALFDIDSMADSIIVNDAGGTPGSSEDNHVDDDGSDSDGDGIIDEDDHDPAQLTVLELVTVAGTIFFDDEDDDIYV